ncbi:MAG: collagen-like protein [Hydrococcus sp. Prado102]|nr:collagen-like protein [Hydrococcus sp. Prado102]
MTNDRFNNSPMRFLGKFSLVLLFVVFPYMLPPASESERCESLNADLGNRLAWSNDIQEFGKNGQNGTNGKNGSRGQDSDNITIFADGSPLTLNLAGQSGTNAEKGGDAKDANCSSQPKNKENNLIASNGGNGGNGGDGGDGGNGGTLTIYATNPANLRQISVNAAGGSGGRPGSGGNGGRGCNCEEPYWTIETCDGDPGDSDYSCSTREFKCIDGKNGTSGSSGRPGRDGSLGKLTLINSDKPLQKDQPSATIPLSELKNTGYILSQNRWETRDGASALFAPGSIIEDRYRVLVERVERSFLLIWNAPQPSNKFADKKVTLSLDKNKNIKVSLPDDLWLEAITQQQNNITQLIVYNAVAEKEATQLKSEGLSGTGSDLKLTLIDGAGRSNLIATKFNLKYRTTPSDPRYRDVSDFTTKFNGQIPPEAIATDGNRFTINLGQLPIETNALRSGTGVEVDLIATRSFAGYSTQQRVVVKDILGNWD